MSTGGDLGADRKVDLEIKSVRERAPIARREPPALMSSKAALLRGGD